jgi:hypothetical protein
MDRTKRNKAISVQGERYAAVAKSNETVFSSSNLFVGTAGDVAVVNEEGDSVIFKNIANGTFLPILCTQVLSTGTDASDIIRIW